jgi:hypothetical protein
MASRSPINGVGYDQSLLAAAPEVTKADKQVSPSAPLLACSIPPAGGRRNLADQLLFLYIYLSIVHLIGIFTGFTIPVNLDHAIPHTTWNPDHAWHF